MSWQQTALIHSVCHEQRAMNRLLSVCGCVWLCVVQFKSGNENGYFLRLLYVLRWRHACFYWEKQCVDGHSGNFIKAFAHKIQRCVVSSFVSEQMNADCSVSFSFDRPPFEYGTPFALLWHPNDVSTLQIDIFGLELKQPEGKHSER